MCRVSCCSGSSSVELIFIRHPASPWLVGETQCDLDLAPRVVAPSFRHIYWQHLVNRVQWHQVQKRQRSETGAVRLGIESQCDLRPGNGGLMCWRALIAAVFCVHVRRCCRQFGGGEVSYWWSGVNVGAYWGTDGAPVSTVAERCLGVETSARKSLHEEPMIANL